MPLTSTAYDERYYAEHLADGLDYTVYGDWQRDYGRWLIDALRLKGATTLDVGCACGSILNGLLAAGAGPNVCGVDLCEPMIARGRAKFPGLRLDICDAANLHLFNAGDFDLIHTNNVAEHWPEQLVPAILRELHRVARPGIATLFLCLDTAELYSDQKRDPAKEDPTHVCIKPIGWWTAVARDCGWKVDVSADELLRAHPLYKRFAEHDWRWLVLRPMAQPASVTEVLANVWHEHDPASELDRALPQYEYLAAVCRELAPRSIVEIGVRAGYSAAVMRWASPGAKLLAIDAAVDDFGSHDNNSHGGFAGAWRDARRLICGLPGSTYLVVDSHAIRRLPLADLVHIDGDHSTEGGLADLYLAAESARVILVDDYSDPVNGVSEACRRFLEARPDWRGKQECGGRYLRLIQGETA